MVLLITEFLVLLAFKILISDFSETLVSLYIKIPESEFLYLALLRKFCLILFLRVQMVYA